MDSADMWLRKRAQEYLKLEFRPQESFALEEVARFDHHPGLGPGDFSIYTFQCTLAGQKGDRFYVVTGTEGLVNYYPDWALTPDDLWAVHIGTEAYLAQGVKTETELDPLLPWEHQARAIAERELGSVEKVEFREAYRLPAVAEYPEELHVLFACTHSKGTDWLIVGNCPPHSSRMMYQPMWRGGFTWGD